MGEQFTEGARLAWLALAAKGWGVNDLRLRMRTKGGEPLAGGVIDRPLYGDGEIGLRFAIQLEKLLGVPARAWLKRPCRAFTLEALRRKHKPKVRAVTGACKGGRPRSATRSAGVAR